MTSTTSKAPDDPGAFGILTTSQRAAIDGAMYWLLTQLSDEARSEADWTLGFLVHIHRLIFKEAFPDQAGNLRHVDVTFRHHAIPTPAQVPHRLADLVYDAKCIIEDARAIEDLEDLIERILPRVARFHANCVVTQPFVDGNKRWARQVLNAILTDTGFYPGTEFPESRRQEYLDGIDKAVGDHPEQLANLILLGWIALNEQFRSGRY